ncbi:MHYT domain-containing protein [Fodinicurvata sp. EGI_FJ10296]|uniref:sensor histidine kinase n=1 Tax=Fodinicurvata sp. EGI_FJ10296 TaxID=3231908 RepID=UPI0034516C0A
MASDPLTGTYNFLLVFMSFAVACLASYAALDIANRIRGSGGARKAGWIAAAAAALGGGIWSMHFIAMLAFALPVDIGYDVGLTLLSLVIAIGVTGVAFTLISYPGGKVGPARILGAGLIMGAGIASMHYTGMEAMILPARLDYTQGLFILSIVIAIAAATAALWISTRETEWRAQLAACFVMGTAIAGMHYTGMAATCIESAPDLTGFGGVQFHQESLAAIIAVSTIFILVLAMVSAAADSRIGALRQREADLLRDSEARFRNLVLNTGDLILVTDTKGFITYAAPSSPAIVGLTPERLIGSRIIDHVDAAAAGAVTAVLTGFAESESAAGAEPITAIWHGESHGSIIFDVILRDLRDERSVGGIVVTLKDITQREQAFRAMREARDLADRAVEAKTRLIGLLGHELKTPLNAIIGFSELWAADVASGSKQAEHAAIVRDSGQRLDRLINQVLELTSVQSGSVTVQSRRLDVYDLLARRVASAAATAAAADVTLELADTLRGGTVEADDVCLGKILGTLIDNAVKFSSAGDAVSIDAAISGDGTGSVITVSDRGPGLDEETCDQAFEPFFQSGSIYTRSHDGAGLGLAIAKAYADLCGFRLSLSPRPGGGLAASITVPGGGTPCNDQAVVAQAATTGQPFGR